MFTDVEFSLLPRGVNVVVGANEAGKTTAMAAIQRLLYGIPVRSPQAYIHSLSNLRVGATLQDEAGTDLAVVRVKRQTNTLRSLSDVPIDEEEYDACSTASLVRSAFLDDDGDAEMVSRWTEGQTLESAYEAAVEQADEIADRLRLEASAVERRLQEIDQARTAELAELQRATTQAATTQQK